MATELDDILIGLVIGRVGQPVPLSEKHANLFLHKLDTSFVDNATKKSVYLGQKPISLLKEVVGLYTSPGDWVFYGPTGISKCIFAVCMHVLCMYVSTNHNCYVAIELKQISLIIGC